MLSNDSLLLNFLNRELIFQGFEVKSIAEQEELFPTIHNFSPDVVLIDFILDDMNGAALCHQVTSNPETRDIQVIIVSDLPNLQKFSNKFGSNAVVNKSLNRTVFVQKILAALGVQKTAMAS